MDYIANVVHDLGYRVNIVSPSYIVDNSITKSEEINIELDDDIVLTLTPSFGAKNKLQKVLRVFQSRWWLFTYLLKNTNKDSKVIVYHNYELAYPVIFAKFFKKFKLILEIEEKYSMVWKLTPFQKHKENLMLKYGKNNSMVVSEVLAEKLGIKDPIVSYGSYNVYSGETLQKYHSNSIRLIYTGSIDKVKGSAYLALEVMKYLPPNYELKLSGPIAKGESQSFINKINDINIFCGRKACEYLGILDDNKYKELLLSANIALNLQNDGDFGQFLFPSKILTYLSYNLPVVSTKGESIVKSSVANLITFSDGYEEESISKAIQSICIDKNIDRRVQLEQLSVTFKHKLKTILSE